MGLDITHYKATLEKPNREIWLDDYVREDDDRQLNVPMEHFRQFMQPILVTEIVRYLKVVKNKKAFDHLVRRDDEEVICCENDKQLSAYLDNFEATIDMNTVTREKYQNHDDTLSIWYTEKQWKQGFYIQEVGYHRKGMDSAFWNRFCTGDIYYFARLEDFEFALSCVIPDYDYAGSEYRQKEFKENFVDKFEDDVSLMGVSY